MGIAKAAQGVYDKFESIDDDYIITGEDIGDAANAQDYIGKSWGEIKQQALGNPIVSLFAKLGSSAKVIAQATYGVLYASFASIAVYKNPITALKEDIKQFLKFSGAGLTIAAALAIAWKIGAAAFAAYLAYKVAKGK